MTDFAPFSVLEDVIYWWHAQEKAPRALKLASEAYFGKGKRKLDEFDPFFQELDMARFAEWYLLSFPLPDLRYDLEEVVLAGKTVAEVYVELLGDEEVNALLASRYATWRVGAATGSRLTLHPIAGGEAVTVDRAAVAAPEGDVLVGRVYLLGEQWQPSPTMLAVPVNEAEGLAALEPDALAQRFAFA